MKKSFWCSGLFIRSLRIVVLCSMLFVLRHDLKAWQPVQEVDWKTLQCVQTIISKLSVAICQEKSNYSTTLLRLWKRNDLVDYAWRYQTGILISFWLLRRIKLQSESDWRQRNSVWLCQQTRNGKPKQEKPKLQGSKTASRTMPKNYSQRVKDWIFIKDYTRIIEEKHGWNITRKQQSNQTILTAKSKISQYLFLTIQKNECIIIIWRYSCLAVALQKAWIEVGVYYARRSTNMPKQFHKKLPKYNQIMRY